MSWVLPLPMAVPLLAAALVICTDHVTPRRVQDAIGVVGTGVATAFAIVAMVATQSQQALHWFGGWQPRTGIVLGIDFAPTPYGAAMAALCCGLAFLSLIFSWTYLKEASRLYDALMLVFCGAMAAFAMSGDLFNMFVWFELMGVAAYALAAFNADELGPVQGAFNFAIVKSLGGYLLLFGIALLYGRTGALNLAQIGHTLAGRKPDGLVVAAFTLVVVGFLVKAGATPFHLWVADAHAVAPAPVCALFAGAEIELGLFAIARVYWTIFDAPFGAQQANVRALLVGLGLLTAFLGALMCALQRHLRRLLAYSTISDVGIVLVGVGLLDSKGLAGAATMVLAHAFLKGSLFLCSGILLQRLRSVDELELHGRGRALPAAGVLWALGALGLVGIPYVGVYLGHGQIDEAAALDGMRWIGPLLAIAAGVSAGAILRAGARVFLGSGPREDSLLSGEPPEQPEGRDASLPLMVSVTAVLVALGLVASVVPGLGQRAERGAERFRDRGAYSARVLKGELAKPGPRLPFAVAPTTGESVAYGILAILVALATAILGLWRERLPEALRAVSARMLGPPVELVRGLHTGVVGDYVTWLVLGTAVIGGVWTITLR